MSHSRILMLYYWLPVFLWMAVIFFLSTSAGGSGNSLALLRDLISWLEPGHTRHLTPDAWEPLNYAVRKMGHITEYTILSLLLMRAFQCGAAKLRPMTLWGALLFAVSYAATDEFHQSFIPGRTSTPRDVAIDGMGILLSVFAIRCWFALKLHEQTLLQNHVVEDRTVLTEA